MKHILFFAYIPFPNDHATLETVFCRHLPEAGYEPIWIFQPLKPEYSGQETEWHGFKAYVTRRRHWRGVRRHVELLVECLRLGRRAFREHDVDIVHVRNGTPEMLVAWWLAKRHRKPLFIQYTAARTVSRRGKIRKTRFRPLATPVYLLFTALTRFLFRQAALVLAGSDYNRDFWKARGVDRIVPFPIGADLSLDPDSVIPVEAPPMTVIFFGGMADWRKYEFLLETFARVLKQEPQAHLLMVGDHSGSNLPDYAHRLGIADAVTFTGQVPRAQVPRYIRAARCSIAAYPPTEPFFIVTPTKVIESLAMKVPAVGNREIPELRKIIEASGGGYAPPYDPDAYAEAILKLLRDPDDAARRGCAGRAYIEREYNFVARSRELIGYYEQALSDYGEQR